MPVERVYAFAALDVPQAHGGVEAGAGQYQARVGIVRARSGRTPLDCVDLFGVRLQVVHPRVAR